MVLIVGSFAKDYEWSSSIDRSTRYVQMNVNSSFSNRDEVSRESMEWTKSKTETRTARMILASYHSYVQR